MNFMQVINDTYKLNLLQKLRKLVWNVSFIFSCVIIGLQPVFSADKIPVLKIAVASNFLLPLRHLKPVFERHSNIKIKITSASTAKLYAQILNGAPFDVFLAADDLTPKKLLKKGLVRSGDVFQYVQGQLVLCSMNSAVKTLDELKLRFTEGEFSRVALANPKTAPYGRAAMDVFSHYSIGVNRAKLILGESVGQAYQFTSSGNVDMGFVALSQIKANQLQGSQMQYWILPSPAYRPILQYGSILRQNRQNSSAKGESAEKFVRYLKSSRVQTLLRDDFGYL